MSQPQPPQSPDQPDQGHQPTQPLWYGETQPQRPTPASAPSTPPASSTPPAPSATAAPSAAPAPWSPFAQEAPHTPAEPHPAASMQPGVELAQPAKPRRRLLELTAIAAITAVLASGTTYAVTRGDATTVASGVAATRTNATDAAPIAQVNPSAPNWTTTAAAVAPSVVSISVQSGQGSGQGSGVVFDKVGHIVTNNHVVAGAGTNGKITVTLHDLRTYDATVVGTDASTDLAVIKIQNAPSDLKPIAMGDADALKVGDPVMAVGNPLGLAGTVTTGIVSALNRPVRTQAEGSQSQNDPSGGQAEPVVTNAIQTSAAINPGNSGGALVNANGQLVGINSSIASLGSSGGSGSPSGNIGIGFAIPANEARSIASQLIKSGEAEHAYLGVASEDATVKDGSASRTGAEISSVASGTPAANAGLQAGDVIIAVDDEPVDSALSLVAQIRERSVGEQAELTVIRDGARKDISVTLASKPDQNR